MPRNSNTSSQGSDYDSAVIPVLADCQGQEDLSDCHLGWSLRCVPGFQGLQGHELEEPSHPCSAVALTVPLCFICLFGSLRRVHLQHC